MKAAVAIIGAIVMASAQPAAAATDQQTLIVNDILSFYSLYAPLVPPSMQATFEAQINSMLEAAVVEQPTVTPDEDLLGSTTNGSRR